jgi:hypothetical protein
VIVRDDPYRPPLAAERAAASVGPVLTAIGLFEVVSGALGLLILLSGLSVQLKLASYAWSTGQSWAAVVNSVLVVGFATLFSFCVAGGVAVLRRQPGRLARLVPLLLVLQSPVLIVPELQFFAALVPPQIGFQIFGDGNIRFGVHFALTTAFKLGFEDTPVPGAVMLNMLPAALLGWAMRRARDSVLFSPRREGA